jgi:hypothetical protein
METFMQNKDTQYACQSIHDFFDCYHLEAAIKEAEKMIKQAARHKAWRTKNPYRPVFFTGKLQELVTAAFTITEHHAQREACIIEPVNEEGLPDLEQKQHFVSRYRSCTTWSNIPRHLTAAQYHDPYIAIKKFTSYATAIEWKQIGHDLAEYALTNYPIDEEYPAHRLLTIRLHILRLIEACHLLAVRSRPPQPQPQPQPQP